MVSSQGNRGILLSLWVIEDKFQNDLKFLRNLADVLYILLSQVYPRMREREEGLQWTEFHKYFLSSYFQG